MSFKIEMDNTKAIPAYRQIYDAIMNAIGMGVLLPGDRLPPERNLARELSVSRGTVRRAYNECKENGALTCTMGGYHLVAGTMTDEEEKSEDAYRTIDEVVGGLIRQGYTVEEISSMFSTNLIKNLHKHVQVRVAVFECRQQGIITLQRQLSHLKNVQWEFILLDDIPALLKRQRFLESYDLMVSTASHYYDVLSLLPDELRPKLVEAVVSWDRKTIFNIASIKKNSHIGVLYTSSRMVPLVENMFFYFQLDYQKLEAFDEEQKEGVRDFFARQTAVICEPNSIVYTEKWAKEIADEFIAGGGKLIPFDHYLEKSSAIHIESVIMSIIKQKSDVNNFHPLAIG